MRYKLHCKIHRNLIRKAEHKNATYSFVVDDCVWQVFVCHIVILRNVITTILQGMIFNQISQDTFFAARPN